PAHSSRSAGEQGSGAGMQLASRVGRTTRPRELTAREAVSAAGVAMLSRLHSTNWSARSSPTVNVTMAPGAPQPGVSSRLLTVSTVNPSPVVALPHSLPLMIARSVVPSRTSAPPTRAVTNSDMLGEGAVDVEGLLAVVAGGGGGAAVATGVGAD